jgi:hypothetical protein
MTIMISIVTTITDDREVRSLCFSPRKANYFFVCGGRYFESRFLASVKNSCGSLMPLFFSKDTASTFSIFTGGASGCLAVHPVCIKCYTHLRMQVKVLAER